MDGPRQVGKTTLGLNILKTQGSHHPAYLNWDIVQHQSTLLKGELPAEETLLGKKDYEVADLLIRVLPIESVYITLILKEIVFR